MDFKLMVITNDIHIAKIIDNADIDWIFIDLEVIGKNLRQGHLDTVISNHTLEDISKLRTVVKKSKIIVRSNPIHSDSEKEINEIIKRGADIIMLPYFTSKLEVEKFLGYVKNRCEVCLLVEHIQAVNDIDKIVSLEGIDYIHIGLNDLHLSLGNKFMFEPLSSGLLDELSKIIIEKNIEFGFGGVSRIGTGTLLAEKILLEHIRLNSSMVILSRSFFDNIASIKKQEFSRDLADEVKKLRQVINKTYTDQQLLENANEVKSIIEGIVSER